MHEANHERATINMRVTESDGEVSATVEETNRVRAAMGLAPLRIGKRESAKLATSSSSAATVPSMRVSEHNGEVSATVEETNRVRAAFAAKLRERTKRRLEKRDCERPERPAQQPRTHMHEANHERATIKMRVTESDGEVSATVEETNRVRAAMGLAPLRIGKRESAKLATSSSSAATVPSMRVSENNGEVSATVEETNRVRAALGLAPLQIGKRETTKPAIVSSSAATVSSAGGTDGSRSDADAKRDEVLSLKLSRYTDLRPTWR